MSIKIEDNITVPTFEAESSQIERDMLKKYTLDRVAGEKLKLPHKFENIQLNPNTVFTGAEFNNALSKLYTNFLYINANTKLLPNDFPNTQKFWFGQINPGATSFQRLSAPNSDSVVAVPGAAVDNIIKQPQCGLFFTRNKKHYTVIGDRDRLIISSYGDNPYTARLLHNGSAIDSGPEGGGYDSANFNFKDISAIAIRDSHLYVCDAGLKKLLKYDISGLFINNPATFKRAKVLIKQIGGKGTNYQKTKFNTCKRLRLNSKGDVYVLDYLVASKKYIDSSDETSTAADTTEFKNVKSFNAEFTGLHDISFEGHVTSGAWYYSIAIVKNNVIVEHLQWLQDGEDVEFITRSSSRQWRRFKVKDLFLSKNDVVEIKFRPSHLNGGEIESHQNVHSLNQIHKFRNLQVKIQNDATKTNTAIKIFDSNLNWKRTLYKSQEFKSNVMVDFDIDPENDDLYFISHDGTIFIYTPEGVLKKKIAAEDNLPKEHYKGIFFSKLNRAILYVYTNKHVIKKFKAHLNRAVGRFKSFSKGEIVGDYEEIQFAISGNVNNSTLHEEVFVGVKQTKATANIANVPRRPVMWGLNHRGQTDLPPEIVDLRLEPFSIRANFNNTFVILPPGRLLGWGDNTYGQLDIPDDISFGNVTGSLYVEDVAVGLKHVVAVLNDGTVRAWGSNKYGQTNVPEQFLTAGDYPSVTHIQPRSCGAGEYHTNVVGKNGKVYAWGLNDVGQVNGVPTTVAPYTTSTFHGSYSDNYIQHANSSQKVPNPDSDNTATANYKWEGALNWSGETKSTITDAISVTDVECGVSHNLAVDVNHDNKVIGWGSNKYQQVQHGSTSNVIKPSFITVGSADLTARQIDGGYAHTIALTGTWPNNTIVSWGLNNFGQVNGVPAVDEIKLANVALSGGDLHAVSGIAAGAFHNLCIISNSAIATAVPELTSSIENTVLTWGSNTYDQDKMPLSLNKIGADLSQVIFVDLIQDKIGDETGPEGTVDIGSTIYTSTTSSVIGNFFNILSAADVDKISAGLGHSAVISSQHPVKINPVYIYEFNIANLYKTIIYDRYKDTCYHLKQIEVSGDELVSNLVINKAFTKMVYNHIMLYNHFHSHFTFTRDDYGVPVYQDVQYNVETPKKFKNMSFDVPNNLFVGINELLVTETLNRPLREIYDMQLALLGICQDVYTDTYPKRSKALDISTDEYI